MKEIEDEREIADLHIQALGQFDETEEYIPSSAIWIAIIRSDKGTGKWFLVTDDSIGGDRAWQFETEDEAMASFGKLQELFRNWLEQAQGQQPS